MRSVSSIADLIKKQYERSADDKGRERKEGKGRRSNLETENMKRVSLWLDKETYGMIQDLIDVLRKERPLGTELLLSKSAELARDTAVWFYERFGWMGASPQLLANEQQKLLERRI